MAYQLSIFDSIPYEVQAKQLVAFIADENTEEKAGKDYDEMANAYRNQELGKLEALINKEEFGVGNFTDLLLYNRNKNWVSTMERIFSSNICRLAVLSSQCKLLCMVVTVSVDMFTISASKVVIVHFVCVMVFCNFILP